MASSSSSSEVRCWTPPVKTKREVYDLESEVDSLLSSVTRGRGVQADLERSLKLNRESAAAHEALRAELVAAQKQRIAATEDARKARI